MKLGLLNTQRLSLLLSNPDKKFRSVHVTGTNGKGSVCEKIAAGLIQSGYRVGLYSSPHISTFRERIQINSELISPEDVVRHMSHVFSVVEKNEIPATFFELTTMLAFRYFAERNVDYAVIEVGIGGRLDATNIITPDLSVIVSIGMDHADILGSTIEAVTREKAGIIKPHVPLVIGPTVSREIINPIASSLRSPVTTVNGPFVDFEAENTAVAREGLLVLDQQMRRRSTRYIDNKIIQNVSDVRAPCRFQSFNIAPPMGTVADSNKTLTKGKMVHVLLDVAHNPPAFTRLFEQLQLRYPNRPVRVVMGFSGEKDVAKCLDVVLANGGGKAVSAIYLVSATHERAARAVELLPQCQARLDARGRFVSLVADGDIVRTTQTALLACAQSTARQSSSKTENSVDNDSSSQYEEILLVCGSFYILKDVRMALGLQSPDEVDQFDLHERTRDVVYSADVLLPTS